MTESTVQQATFDRQKKKYVKELASDALDKSKKGTVDDEVKGLLDAVNAHPDLYSTSSCAGRIDLFVEPLSGKKHEGEWLFVSHQPVAKQAVLDALTRLPGGEATVWFRMEGAILHVCARDLVAANVFLQSCKESGWKHSGITGSSKRVIVEATTSERMDVPVAKEGALFVPEKFISFLVKEANKKLSKTREKIERLRKNMKNV